MDASPAAERDGHRSGVLYCAAELSVRGWDVSFTGSGSSRYDLLAVRCGHAVHVRCKTAGEDDRLTVGLDFEQPRRDHAPDREWVIFVTLRPPGRRPVFHVLPRRIAVTVIWYAARHAVPGRQLPDRAPRPVPFDDLRWFREAWGLLAFAPGGVPWLIDLDRPFWQWAAQMPLPAGFAAPAAPDEVTFSEWERRRAAI
jgi:hypothetical protein